MNSGQAHYYKVILPLNMPKLYTYSSGKKLEKGVRVLVVLRDKPYTGIIFSQVEDKSLNKKLRYSPVLEVVDEKPLIDPEIFELGGWISRYYKCNLGIVMQSMLPNAFKVECLEHVRLAGSNFEDISASDDVKSIIRLLNQFEWVSIRLIKQNTKVSELYKLIEELEDSGILEVKRSFDEKVKKKYANYIFLKNNAPEIVLTRKQEDLYNLVKGFYSEKKRGQDFPLARVVDDFSYSVVKSLKNKGLISVEARELKVATKKSIQAPARAKTVVLNSEQNHALDLIKQALKKSLFKSFLLYGVTGSGKTEVYLNAIKTALSFNRGSIVLVPEISLTPQMVNRFLSFFDNEVAILHSRLSYRERWTGWKKINSGEVKIVLGVRSAIFAPVKNLGLIVVDEEHESSYKQDKNPRYNARDLALVRGRMNKATVILGSATPSLESWENSNTGKYTRITLEKRPFEIEMPIITVVDLRSEKNNSLISEKLNLQILDRLKKKEQIILLQNRRGYASYLICVSCGKVFQCPDCEISLNYHSHSSNLLCHYCGFRKEFPKKCDECGSYVFDYGTAGTQKLEKQLRLLYPKARLLRMDADTVSAKSSYDEMFERMTAGEIDILFGTQMIAKGLDFSNVTLVGVINADVSLNVPDFRATERTFQLLTQVAGRSGRSEKKGEVIIQSYNPDCTVIKQVRDFDFSGFTWTELDFRKRLSYPPFFKLARILYSNKDEVKLKLEIDKVQSAIKELTAKVNEQCQVMGPLPAPFYKLKEKYRYHVICRAESYSELSLLVDQVTGKTKLSSTIKIDLDIDPYSLL